eukprot:9485803-Pyramimonas_sp.AAC.1
MHDQDCPHLRRCLPRAHESGDSCKGRNAQGAARSRVLPYSAVPPRSPRRWRQSHRSRPPMKLQGLGYSATPPGSPQKWR